MLFFGGISTDLKIILSAVLARVHGAHSLKTVSQNIVYFTGSQMHILSRHFGPHANYKKTKWI